MPPGLQRRAGFTAAGVGSNQYQSKPGTAPTVDPAQVAAVRQAVETEELAWAFDPAPVRSFDERMKQMRAIKGDNRFVRRAAHPDRFVRAEVAKMKSCPPELLDILADDPTREVVREALQNPACPVAALHRRWQDHPLEVQQNPACPPEILDAIYAAGKGTRHLLDNPNLSKATRQDATDRWAAQVNAKARAHGPSRSAAQDPFLDHQLLHEWVFNEKKDQQVWRGVVLNPTATAAMLDHLANEGDLRVRRGVAGHPNTTNDTLERLTHDGSKEVRWRAERLLVDRGVRSEMPSTSR